MKRLLALAIGLILPLGADDETGFSTAPGASWERVDQLSRAVFDFSGGEFRLQCAAPTLGEASVYGLARGALLAPSVFGDCASSVDLTAWAPTTDRGVDGCFPAVLTRIQSPAGIGSVSGYGLSIIDLGNGTAQLQIHRLDGEVPSLLAGPQNFPIDPGHAYRLVLVSRGGRHTGRLFDLEDLSQPLAEVVAVDSTYGSGRCGVSVSTDRLVAVEAVFDNFLAWDGTPPALTVVPALISGTVRVSGETRRSLASIFQAATDFTELDDSWLPATPQSTVQSGDQSIVTFVMDGPRCFFRRRGL